MITLNTSSLSPHIRSQSEHPAFHLLRRHFETVGNSLWFRRWLTQGATLRFSTEFPNCFSKMCSCNIWFFNEFHNCISKMYFLTAFLNYIGSRQDEGQHSISGLVSPAHCRLCSYFWEKFWKWQTSHFLQNTSGCWSSLNNPVSFWMSPIMFVNTAVAH